MYVHEVAYKQAVARAEQYRQEAAQDHALTALRPSFRSRAASVLHSLAEKLEPGLNTKPTLNVR